MFLLLSQAAPSVAMWHATTPEPLRQHLGRLLTPRDYANPERALDAGLPVAADNRAFVGFDPRQYRAMLERVRDLPLLFAVVPDSVADAAATDVLWKQWAPEVASYGVPPAYVAQDGMRRIPDDAGALFVGGSTDFKLGPAGARAVAEALERGLHVHVGRVNTGRRVAYCKVLGAQSFDGTQWSRWSRTHLPTGLALAAAPAASRLFDLAP